MESFDINSNSGIFVKKDINISNFFTEITLLYSSDKGYCNIYKGKRYGRWHILKTLKAEYKDSIQYQQLLQKEFHITYQLSHPNIVQTIGMEDIDNIGKSIIMEYIDGETLDKFIKSYKPSITEILNIIKELCSAIDYIHQKQIIHRDIKPTNIIITYNGIHVKLIDFGIADSTTDANFKYAIGTKDYASPEQTRTICNVDNRSDLFSLGKTLEYFFSELGIISSRYNKIINKCIQPDRNNRYRYASEIYLDISKKHKISPFIIPFFTIILILITIFTTYFFTKASINTNNTSQIKVVASIDIFNKIANDIKFIAKKKCNNVLINSNNITDLKDRQIYFYVNQRNFQKEVDSIVNTSINRYISPYSPEYTLYRTNLITLYKDIINKFFEEQLQLIVESHRQKNTINKRQEGTSLK